MRKKNQVIRICALLLAFLPLAGMADCHKSPTTEPSSSGTMNGTTNGTTHTGGGGGGY